MESNISYRELSERIGKGATYISTMIRNKNDPGLSTVIEICKALGIGLGELVNDNEYSDDTRRVKPEELEEMLKSIASEVTARANASLQNSQSSMTIEDMMSWWHQHGGRLENVDNFLEDVDLFHPPCAISNTPKPARVGKSSLVTRKFNIENENNLEHLLQKMEGRWPSNIAEAHYTALKGQPLLRVVELDVIDPNKNERVTAKYSRLLLPVRDFARNSLVLNFTKPIN